jgi:hypothetical protein
MQNDSPIGTTGDGGFFSHFYDPSAPKGREGLKGFGTPAPERAKDYVEEIKKIAGCTPGGINNLSGENKKKAYEYFGKIMHLLQDMAVPSHTKDDAHPFKKPFEKYINDNWDKIVSSQAYEDNVAKDKYRSGKYKFADISQYWDSLAKIKHVSSEENCTNTTEILYPVLNGTNSTKKSFRTMSINSSLWSVGSSLET